MSALLIAATPSSFGGWAVVTFDDVPDYLIVDTPTTFTFKIRQHGQTLVNDRSPSLTLKNDNSGFVSRFLNRNTIGAVRTLEDGEYTATITPTEVGTVTMVVDTDVARWKTQLIPISVRAAGDPMPAPPLEDRGRQLFAAKGCATCHAKLDEPAFADWRLLRVGPDLTARTFPQDWLAEKIRDPDQFAAPPGADRMPNLNVSEPQIAAIVRYINHGQSTTVTSLGPHPNGS